MGLAKIDGLIFRRDPMRSFYDVAFGCIYLSCCMGCYFYRASRLRRWLLVFRMAGEGARSRLSSLRTDSHLEFSQPPEFLRENLLPRRIVVGGLVVDVIEWRRWRWCGL